MKNLLLFCYLFSNEGTILEALLLNSTASLHSFDYDLALFLIRILPLDLFKPLVVVLSSLAVRVRVYFSHLVKHVLKHSRVNCWRRWCFSWKIVRLLNIQFSGLFLCLSFGFIWLRLKLFKLLIKFCLLFFSKSFGVILQMIFEIGFELFLFWGFIVLSIKIFIFEVKVTMGDLHYARLQM